MKVGLSTYSLNAALQDGRHDVLSGIEWISENGGEHVEIVPIGFSLEDDESMIGKIVDKAKACGIDISSYTLGASFLQDSDQALADEIARIKRNVDIGNALGVKFMRHDVASRPIPETTVENFLKDLPVVTAACQEIADHAKQYGITTSLENHGYHFQGSERVQQLILAVDRENFRTTMDIGNFLCADELPTAAVTNNIPFASFVHFKDFLIRDGNPGEGWFPTRSGRSLRGTIVGQGDINTPAVVKIIKDYGYDGYLSVEFEGKEDCLEGSRIGMANLRRMWDET